MDEKKLAQSLTVFERKVLPNITKKTIVKSLMDSTGLQEIEVLRSLQWLVGKELIELEDVTKKIVTLDDNGHKYKDNGLPEIRFLKAIDAPMHVGELKEKAKISDEEVKISIGLLRRKSAINLTKDGDDLVFERTKAGDWILNQEIKEEEFLKKEFPFFIEDIDGEESKILKDLLKRKGILSVDTRKEFYATITVLGDQVAAVTAQGGEYVDTLTPELLKTGDWKDKDFRKYDLKINVPRITGGRRHFVSQAVEYIRRIWIELGFTEMRGPLVQTAFWDLDALFVPQDHPARDEQDTYFLEDPKTGKLPPIWNKVKEVHETGGKTGSKGWGGKYSKKLAEQLLMITHDTYMSAKVLANAKEKDLPIKTFQIMKAFRNEALDWKHLFEFYQVGGIVVDKNANFRNLIYYLETFFKKMGYEKIRIRPGSFPYTEPSAEIEVFNPKKKEWVELGGCGMFRPEVVAPLLGFECPVLAWGFGMARVIADYWGITDIRDLYRNDLKQIREMKEWMK